jgi:hypothetical protein
VAQIADALARLPQEVAKAVDLPPPAVAPPPPPPAPPEDPYLGDWSI